MTEIVTTSARTHLRWAGLQLACMLIDTAALIRWLFTGNAVAVALCAALLVWLGWAFGGSLYDAISPSASTAPGAP